MKMDPKFLLKKEIKEMTKISIVIPTFNRGHFLAYSLYLYAKQTMKDFEIIIIDDGSIDNTFEICQTFKKFLSIRYFRSDRKNKQVYQSGGPLINFAVKNVATGDIILYADPEVMPFPDFVEKHCESHQPGTIIAEPTYIAPRVPGRDTTENRIVQNGEKALVKGLTLKMWIECARIFGTWEDWKNSGAIKNIVQFWNDTWTKVMSIPYDYLPPHDKGYGYKDGSQDFWGFQGSQAGLSFPKDIFLQMQGWDESIEKPGYWMGEDGELWGRAIKHGMKWINNPNIRAVHIYHPKPPTYTDEERKTLILDRNANIDYKIANQDIEWGSAERLKIKEWKL